MEVIARKKSALFGLYIVFVIVGLVFSLVSIFFMVTDFDVFEFFLLAVGALCIVLGIIAARRVQNVPDELITYDGEKLYFAGGLECKPCELTNVSYDRARARGFQYAWGTLRVVVNGEERNYEYVADVVDVHDRLLELMLEARENKEVEEVV